jgi:hypothetical protein
MYILDGNVTTAIVDAIRSLMVTFCSLIYGLIMFCFDVFEKVGAANDILSTDIIVNITNKISLILGLFMIFRLTFAFVQYLINPDTMNDKNKGAGSLVMKMIIAIVLLGTTPYMFKFAFSLQNAINDDKIIPRIIMGYSPDESDNATIGGMIAQSTFFTFFRVNENVTCNDSDADLAIVTTDAIEEDLKHADFSLLSTYVNQKCNLNDDSTKKDYIYEMDAGGLGCLIIGFTVLYIVFIFTIQLVVRLFQLAYLQVIAPIPIMMYITPKGDEKLKKWGSQCLTTFLDYFLRTAIIYFVLYLIQQITRNFDSSSLSSVWQTGNNVASKSYILGVLIIGLLVFAKKVPNLLKEIFPSIGGAAGFSYSMKLPDEAKKVGLFGAGAALGAAGAAASNVLYGAGSIRKNWKENEGTTGQKLWQATKGVFGTGASAIGGAASGLNKGRKIKDLKGVRGVVQQTNDNRDKRDLKQAAGYTVKDSIFDSIAGFAGLDTKAEGMIKEAQWQQQASEASRSAIWKEADDLVKTRDITPEYYSIARSIRQTKDANGKIQWKGLDRGGKEIIFDDASLETGLRDMSVGADDSIHAADLASAIRANADVDKRIKDEGKKIKGLEAAKNDAKK